MAYIKEIKMQGFKSFGNKQVTIPFTNDFVCVIGPNGSGKSNIVDAINFTLGSRSTKNMRAEKVSDLLFSGGAGKDGVPAEECYVEIVFDNSDFSIPFPEPEVLVSRELKRNGQSTYRLNNTRLSKTEIVDKLRIAGIDIAEGHNIIVQGKVAEIVSMLPEDRRKVIEDIAGTSSFDEKKDEANKGLDEANRRLDELSVLLAEIETQYNTMKKEKDRLEKYLDLSTKIKEIHGRLYSLKIYQHAQKLAEVRIQLNEQNEELQKLETNKSTEVSSKLEELTKQIEITEKKIEDFQKEYDNCRKEYHTQELEQVKLKEEIKHLENQVTEYNTEGTSFQQQYDDYKKKIEESKDKMTILTQELENYQTSLQQFQTAKDQLEKEIAELEQLFDTKDQELNDAKHELRGVDDRLTRVGVQLNMSRSITENMERNLSQKELQIKQTQDQIETYKKGLTELVDKRTQLEGEIELLSREINSINDSTQLNTNKIQELENLRRNVDDEKLILETKVNTLKNFLKSNSGDPPSYKYIMKLKQDGIAGIEDRLEKIYPGHLPTNIAHLADAIVVDSVSTAVKIIVKLKEDAVGTATLLARDALSSDKKVINSWDFVKKIVEKSGSAGDVTQAASLWKKKPEILVLSSQGDVFQPNGVIFGGFHAETAKVELETLQAKLGDLASQQESLKQNLAELHTELTDLTNKKKVDETKINQHTANKQKLSEQIGRVQEAINQNNNQIKQFEEERSPMVLQIQERKIQLHDHETEEQNLLKERENLKQLVDTIQAEINKIDLNGKKNDFVKKEKEVNAAENQIFRVESQLESITRINDEGERQLELLQKRISDNKQRLADLVKKVEEKTEQQAKYDEEIAKIDATSEELKSQINAEKKDLKTIKQEYEVLHQDLDRVQALILQVKEKIHELQIEEERFSTLVNSVQEEAKGLNAPLEILTEETAKGLTIPGLEKQMDRFEEQIKELQPVNMKAKEEFDRVEKRYNEFHEQQQMLIEERNSITDFITQIEIEKTVTFMKVFDRINNYFRQFFAELSEGTADLILENPEKNYEAVVPIMAPPRAIKQKSLDSMSGGEKSLSAQSFNYATQQVNHQPFYVLDEVDAALDPSNVEKLGKLIHRISQDAKYEHKGIGAQFIVISHREILMAKANQIFGVTSDKGVSLFFTVDMQSLKETEKKKEKESVQIQV